MKKVAFLLIALLLVACNATTDPSAESATAVPASEDTVEQSEEVEEQPEETADTAVSAGSLNNDITIATTPEEAGIVRDRDWVKGAVDPKITIIEYGDFQ